MKLYLDDERQPPVGWVLVKTAHDAIQILSEQEVNHVSLDHDLGPEENGTGYDVLLWIEEQVATAGYRPPIISIHTANTSAFVKMTNAVSKITQLSRTNDV
jgi:hypothetical protein